MSIKGQLTSLIIATVVLASFFAALQGFRSSMRQLDTVFDQELKTVGDIVSNIAIRNQYLPSELENELESEIAFQIIFEQTLINKSSNAPTEAIYSEIAGFSEKTFFAQRWRTYTVKKQGYTIVVAQAIKSRIESAESILFVTITPIIIAIPIIAFLVIYIIRKSLQSLIMLSNELKSKGSNDLTFVNIDNPPVELKPVIDRLNHLLRRVDESFEREKQLTANAAHELRTPISVLTITAHNIAEDFKSNQLQLSAIRELTTNVERMAHVIEQMIALFRYTPEQFSTGKQIIDLQILLQEVISNNFNDIEQKNQSISLNSEKALMLGDQFALYTAFENILRNAIKYSGQNSEIKISLTQQDLNVTIAIEDSGCGINIEDYERIFERFYRVSNEQSRHNSLVKGSGLGLAIVKHIIELHEGNIHCEQSVLGGLKMLITLALHDNAE